MARRAGLSGDGNLIEEYKKTYGSALGEIFYHLRNDHADLWLTYKQYRSLFGTNKERVDLVNKHAGTFFYNVERQFWNACILSLCRLTDPARMGKRANLSLETLLDHIESEELRTEVTDLIKNAQKLSSFARERRNKKIGHSDFDIRSAKAKIATIATRKKMSEAIDATHKPLRLIALRLADVDMRQTVIDGLPNEVSLLYSLFAAETGKETLNKLRREKWNDTSPTETIPPNYPYPKWLIWEQEI